MTPYFDKGDGIRRKVTGHTPGLIAVIAGEDQGLLPGQFPYRREARLKA